MGRAQGAVGFGPVTSRPSSRAAAWQQAIAAVDAGGVAVVDVRVEPGYYADHDRGDDAGGRADQRQPPVLNRPDCRLNGLRHRLARDR